MRNWYCWLVRALCGGWGPGFMSCQISHQIRSYIITESETSGAHYRHYTIYTHWNLICNRGNICPNVRAKSISSVLRYKLFCEIFILFHNPLNCIFFQCRSCLRHVYLFISPCFLICGKSKSPSQWWSAPRGAANWIKCKEDKLNNWMLM